MDLLIGPNLHVILSVKEGRGFGFLEHPVGLCVEASLNGHALSTEIAAPSAEIIFDAELLWEAEKKALKRLRSANIPLKVECFMVTRNKRDRIGYIPINLKAAQIALPDSTISSCWHTLLGLGLKSKGHHPQLLLSFRITDPVDNQQDISIMPHGNYNLNDYPRTSHHYKPELLQDEGIIQIGPKEVATDMFLLTICVGQAMKLDLLTDIDQVHADSFYFALKILGYVIQAGSFSDISSFPSNTVEKIVIRIRSSMEILKTYFTEVSMVTLRFMLGNKEIAFSDLDITLLVPTYNLSAFCSQFAINNTMAQRYRCFLVKSQTGKIPISSDGSRPYVNIIIKIKYLSGDDGTSLAQGDVKKLHDSTSAMALPVIPTVASSGDLSEVQPASTLPTHQETCEVNAKPMTHISSDSTVYTFSLDITLQSILFYKVPLHKIIMFRFNMPNATVTPPSHHEIIVEQTNITIPLQGLMCNMKLKVNLDELHHQLLTQPPVVTVCALSEDNVVPFSCAILDMGLLLIKEQKDCCYTAALRDITTNEGHGVLVISLSLEDCIPCIPLVKPDTFLKPPSVEHKRGQPILDDGIAYKIVEELEEWKDRQEELFRAELKKKERAYMDSVLSAWELRRKTFETSMNNSVEQCSMLAKSLNDTTESLRIKSQTLTRRELELIHLEKTLQQEYQLKACELRESTRRQDDDNNLKISKLKLEKVEILEKLKSLEKDLQDAQNTIHKQEEELSKMTKNSLTLDQTAALLQELKSVEEKHECALRSKAFFKEQWARAVREIHRIKSEHQKALQIEIKHNREELHRLGLKDLLIGNVKEMQGDQAILQKLRTELNKHHACMEDGEVLNKKALNLMNKTDHVTKSMPCPLKASSSTNLPTSAPHVDESECQLKQLVEERDSLLNTGNYTLEDAVVVKLNKEIRQLLIQSNGNT